MNKIIAILPACSFSFLFYFYNLILICQMVTWNQYFLFLKKSSNGGGC